MREALRALRCPGCGGALAAGVGGGLECQACNMRFSAHQGVPDLAPHLALDDARFAPEQRAMNTRAFARLYESPLWRPLHTLLASGQHLEREVDELLSPAWERPVATAVDLACGTGLYARAMAARRPSALVLGVDLSLPMLARARVLAERRDVKRICFVRGDVHHLPLANASVDHLNCAGALHLFTDRAPIWREIARVLAPGGVFTAMALRRPQTPGRVQGLFARRASFFPLDPETLGAELELVGLRELHGVSHRAVLLFRAVRAAPVSRGAP